MKKLFAIVLTACLALAAFSACGSKNSDQPNFDGNLEDYVTALYDGIGQENMPMTMNTPITAENAEMFLGTADVTFKDGVASDAMISAIAHSVCLLRTEDADQAAELAKVVEENANPRKWVCVEAEKTVVKQRCNLVLLVMTDTANADAIVANFDKLEA